MTYFLLVKKFGSLKNLAYLCTVVKQLKNNNNMKTIEIKTANNQITTVILDKRIDANMFSCKSSLRKRNADLLVHIDYILTDVSEVSYEKATYTNSNTQNVMSQDEFDGVCQANEIGENPFKCTIMCSNTELNEVSL